jgi:hypothetical protein
MLFTKLPTSENNCCTPQPRGKIECPKCNEKAKGVLEKTLKHLLTYKAKESLSCLDGFYYCKTPSCEVIYFRDTEIFTQKDMSLVVGLKKDADPATVCYCFDWNKEEITKEIKENAISVALEDIKYKMDTQGCECEILNPSGSCCLGDVRKAIEEIKMELNLT